MCQPGLNQRSRTLGDGNYLSVDLLQGLAIAGPAPLHTNEANQQISNTAYGLQHGYCFFSTLQISQQPPSGLILSGKT